MFLTNICGNAAGPIVYGFLSDKFKAKDPTLAWKITMCYYILGFISAIIAVILNYKYLKGKDEKPEKKAPELRDASVDRTPINTELAELDEGGKA